MSIGSVAPGDAYLQDREQRHDHHKPNQEEQLRSMLDALERPEGDKSPATLVFEYCVSWGVFQEEETDVFDHIAKVWTVSNPYPEMSPGVWITP